VTLRFDMVADIRVEPAAKANGLKSRFYERRGSNPNRAQVQTKGGSRMRLRLSNRRSIKKSKEWKAQQKVRFG